MTGDTTHSGYYNVPVKVSGWHEDTGARVELLVSVPEAGARQGQEFFANLRYDPKKLDKYQVTFNTYRKKGLLTGGIVLLKKLSFDEPGVVSAKELEVILDKPKHGQYYLSPGAAVSILPPPPGSRMVNAGLVAMMDQVVAVDTVIGAMQDIELALELARSFGQAGIILTGEEEDGSAGEFVVTREGNPKTEELCNSLMASLSSSLVAHIENSSTPKWFLVPFFKTEIAPDRASRLSAQRANQDFGSDEELSWSVCNCILRNNAANTGWMISDTTPMTDELAEPDMLLNILETRDVD
jgi:hypothetical protein